MRVSNPKLCVGTRGAAGSSCFGEDALTSGISSPLRSCRGTGSCIRLATFRPAVPHVLLLSAVAQHRMKELDLWLGTDAAYGIARRCTVTVLPERTNCRCSAQSSMAVPPDGGTRWWLLGRRHSEDGQSAEWQGCTGRGCHPRGGARDRGTTGRGGSNGLRDRTHHAGAAFGDGPSGDDRGDP